MHIHKLLLPVYWLTVAGWRSAVHLAGYPYNSGERALCGQLIGGGTPRAIVWPVGPDRAACAPTCKICISRVASLRIPGGNK